MSVDYAGSAKLAFVSCNDSPDGVFSVPIRPCADNGVAVIISTEPTAHGIMCVGITNDVGNLSSNALLKGCALDF